MSLHRPAGSLTQGADPLVMKPEQAGWTYSGLRVLRLAAGESRTIDTRGDEFIVLPLSGAIEIGVGPPTSDSTATAQTDVVFSLSGRASVFERVTDWAYVPIRSTMTLMSAGGGEFALCSARAAERLEPYYGSADSVAVELRGGGQASRQINNFASPEQFSGADKLMCVEVYTPDGNWSSYPPHKHDDSPECEVNNEEIYYFRIGTAGSTEYSRTGFGLHRTYTGAMPDGELQIDENVMVRDGDLFLVPRGYHGPCVAAPGYTMYYLNVLAGPGGKRSMAFCDDPAHHWMRDVLSSQPMDERLPLMTVAGPR